MRRASARRSCTPLWRRSALGLAAALVGAFGNTSPVAAQYGFYDARPLYMVAPLGGEMPRRGLVMAFGCSNYGSGVDDAQVFTWGPGTCDALVRALVWANEDETPNLMHLLEEVDFASLPERVTVVDPDIAATCISFPDHGHRVWGLLRGQMVPGYDLPPAPEGLSATEERANMMRYSRVARALQLIADKTLLLDTATPVRSFPLLAPAPGLVVLPSGSAGPAGEPLKLRLLIVNRWDQSLRLPRLTPTCEVWEPVTEVLLTARAADGTGDTCPVRWQLADRAQALCEDLELQGGETVELTATVALERAGRWRLRASAIARPHDWTAWEASGNWVTGRLEIVNEPTVTVTAK